MLRKVVNRAGGPERLVKITAACSVLLLALCVYFVYVYTATCHSDGCVGYYGELKHYNIDTKGMMVLFGMFGLVVLIAGGFATTTVYTNYQKAVMEQEAIAKNNAFRVLNHELRTPLNGIIGISQILRSGIPPNESLLIALDTAARHLGLLVSNVTTESLIVNGEQLGVNIKWDLVRETLEEVASILQDMAISRKVDIEVLVDCDPTLEIPYDAQLLKQVLLNLGGNAVKHTKKGSVTLACEVIPNEAAIYSVRDTGGGIPKDKIPNLFKPYQQLDPYTNNRSHDGIGLGLAVTQKIVDAVGGKISVNSVLGAGTEISIYSPLSGIKKYMKPVDNPPNP